MRTAILAAVAAALILPSIASAALPARDALDRGVLYIQTTQQADGGFGGFGPGQTMDAIYAIRAAGYDPNTMVSSAGKTPADFLIANAAGATSAGAAAKAVLAAQALGLDPSDVGGVDVRAVLDANYDGATGRYAPDDFTHAIAMVAVANSGGPVPAAAIDALRATQVSDGGWGFDGFSDPDTTGIAVQALADAGIGAADPDLAEAIAYLDSTQIADGGWGFGESNVSSTAYIVQALLSLGYDPEGAAWAPSGATPIDYILSQQQADGSFAGFDPAFATNQALPALAGRSFGEAPDTPVTEVLPTPTPTTQPGSTPAATSTPRPPATGSGESAGDGSPVLLLALAVVAMATGGMALAAARRR